MRRLIASILVLVVSSVGGNAFAAEVIERLGAAARITGEVTAVSRTTVSIKTNKGETLDIPVGEVVEIQWTGEPVALKTARADEQAGRLPKALAGLEKALVDNKSTSDYLKADLAYLTARTATKIALSDPAKVEDALKKMADFQKTNPDSRHFFESASYLMQLNLAKGDTAAARKAAEELGKSALPGDKMASQIALGRILLAENKLPEAQKEFEAVSQMKGESVIEKSRQQEAKLGLARCLQLQSQFDPAIKMLDEVIQESAAEDSRVQAEAYLRQGDCYQSAGKTKEALLAYLHVDVLFSTEKTFHPEALYNLSRLWTAVQQPERAADSADRLLTDYPNSPWSQKVKNP